MIMGVSMKQNFLIFILIFLITIGYAAVTTILDIKGNINVAENIEDFKIEISNLKINNSDSKTLISKDKQSFTFTGSGSNSLEYTVTNYSYQYDANISLICTPSENIVVEQISNLPAQERSTKSITSTNTIEIICTINVEKISRIDYAEDMCKYVEGTEWTFDYTGAEQEFTVPCDGNYKIEAWGAQGGTSSGYPDSGGMGAYVSGNLDIKRDKKLYIYVGSGRQSSVASYNGMDGVYGSVGSGGGATDVRITNGVWSNFDSLKSRIIVAAGGGSYFNGGKAGGLVGYSGNCTRNGSGGTQISAGISASNWHAAFGKAGLGCAGGGGYYGGAGGADCGAGGSSFISGHNGCDAIAENSTSSNIIHTGQPNHYSGYVFTDTTMVDGAGYNWTTVKGEQIGMPTHDGKSTMTGNEGNGYAKITYLGK